ncbi:MAG: hypothetical protein JXQ75_10580 [Phycisphaerae bacterium]|nr:hypothetical protein [Phycisphaerae bacterium]
MQNAQHDPNAAHDDDSIAFYVEAQGLRRKLIFWRRAAWLLLGIALLISVVVWQRTTVRCRECRRALQHYAEMAHTHHLDQEPAEVLESQWQNFAKGPADLSAAHYALIVQNWLQTPPPGESLPLAICRDSHVGFFTRSRHVLFRDDAGRYTIKTLTEDEASPILAQIRQDDRSP